MVPAMMGSYTIYHGMNGNPRHIMIVRCMAASAGRISPCVITSQESRNFRQRLKTKGIEFGRHVILGKSQKSQINSKSFFGLFPRVMKVRIDR
jgi:hypothetical protein